MHTTKRPRRMKRRRIPIAERLFKKCKRNKDTGCLDWQGAVDAQGCGKIREAGTLRNVPAARVAWESYFGPIPPDHGVMRTCTSLRCVEKDHLHLYCGQVEKNKKMLEKGTLFGGQRRGFPPGVEHPKGEDHWKAKLTDDQIRAIRDDGRKLRQIAVDYGVSLMSIWYIRKRRTWKHVE